MKDIAREFMARLEAEKDRFKKSFEYDQDGLLILITLREMDCFYYKFIRNERTESGDRQMHMMQLALPKIVVDILSAIPAFQHPVISFQSDINLILVVHEMMETYGLIEQGHRYALSVMSGECQIQQFDDYQYDFVMPTVSHNMEQHEDTIEQYYRNILREHNYRMMHKILGDTPEKIRCLVRDNVFVYDKHYMGYNPVSDLDDFFFELASNEIKEQSEWDSLNWNLEFGGIPLLKFILAATYFLSLAMKHDSFAEALIEKSPNIRLRDILSIVMPKQQVENLMSEAINTYGTRYTGFTPLTRREAQTILKVLSVSRDNLKLLESTMAPLPFLIEYSDTTWVTSVSTIQLGTLSFLLNSLRHHFQADYDRNQRTREGDLQETLRKLLRKHIPEVTLKNNFEIKCNGKTLTDVDFTAADKQDGTIILFQLKHQESYGLDERKRSNRAEQMQEDVGHWLQATRNWLAKEPSSVRRALGLHKNFESKRIYLAVIAKPSAYFLHALDLQSDAVYATLFQLIDVFNQLNLVDGPLTLGMLVDTLQRNMTHKVAKDASLNRSEIYHLPEVAYRVRWAAPD